MKKHLYQSLIAGVIAADGMGKLLARTGMIKTPAGEDSFCRIELLENRGAAGGILSENKELLNVLSGTVVSLVLLELLKEAEKKPLSARGAGLALVAGGGISNLADRLSKGSVTDYIRFPKLPGRTAGRLVFNLSDFAISAGWILTGMPH